MKRKYNIPGYMKTKGALLADNAASHRYIEMVKLRPQLENIRLLLEEGVAKGVVHETTLKAWEFYSDRVEGRPDSWAVWANDYMTRNPVKTGAVLGGAVGGYALGPVGGMAGAAAGALMGYSRGIQPYAVERWSGWITGLEAAAKLGLYPVSAIGNMTQTFINTFPVIGGRWVASGYRTLLDPRKKELRRKVLGELGVAQQTGKTDVVEVANMKDILELARPDALCEAAKLTYDLATAAVMLPFNGAEYMNRSVAGLGSYNRARASGMSHKDAIDKARQIITRTQFHLGPADKPLALQASRLLDPVTQFKTFMTKQSEFMWQLNRGTADSEYRFDSRAEEMAKFWLAMASIVGVAGFYASDNFDDVVSWISGAVSEEDIRPFRSFTQAYPRVARGLPGMLAEVDLTAQSGFADWLSARQVGLENLAGPFASDIAALRAWRQAPEGRDKERAGERLWRTASPSFRRLFQYWQVRQDPGKNFRDVNGNIIIKAVTPWEQWVLMFGFTPIRVSEAREAYEVARRISERTRSIRGMYIDLIVDAYSKQNFDEVRRLRELAKEQGEDIPMSIIRSTRKRKDLTQIEQLMQRSTGAGKEQIKREVGKFESLRIEDLPEELKSVDAPAQ